MRVKLLVEGTFDVVAVMDGEDCPTEQFINGGDANTAAARQGLVAMLEEVADNGLGNMPASWSHMANKKLAVYEFIKGPLRLFYFKGDGRQIAVCGLGVRKSGQKADKAGVKKTAGYRAEYFKAVEDGDLEVLDG